MAAESPTPLEPKRVWRIAHSESSPESGGQERRILTELTGLRRRGSTSVLFALQRSWIFKRAHELGLEARSFSSNRLQFPWAMFRLSRQLRQFRAQVLNTHSSRDAWIAGVAGRWAGVPLIIRTRHFDVPVRNRALSRIVYESLADHLIATSATVSAHFQEMFQWPPDRVTTLPTGVDMELFCPDGPISELFDGVGKLPRIGMIGVLRGAKGHDILLNAVQWLRDQKVEARYYIVGEGPMRPGIQEQIQELHLGDCVTLTGHRDDVPAILRGLDLLVIPSRHEGVPQVGLQALASGLPVVGSKVGGIPEIVEPSRTGWLFPAGDSAALGQTIRDALQDRSGRAVMAQHGRDLVRQRYSLTAMLDRLEELYARSLPASQLN